MNAETVWALGLATMMALASLAQGYVLMFRIIDRLDRIEQKLDSHIAAVEAHR